MYDIDGSGNIDFTEFIVLYHIMNDGTPEEVIREGFILLSHN